MNRLGYLSAATRVSTRDEADLVGPRAHILGVMRGFKQHGWDVKSYIVGDRVPRRWIEPGSGRVAKGGGLRTLGVDLFRALTGGWHAGRAYFELRDEVDWVYERGALLGVLGWGFKRRGIPWILETNSLQYKEALEDRETLELAPLARWMEFTSYEKCDVLVTVSRGLRDLLVGEGIDPEKIVVLPNAVDVELFDPSGAEAEEPQDRFTVGFVGSLYGWQALDRLIEAVADLVDEGLDLGVVVVGDGECRSAWERLARDLGITDRVTFTGFVPRGRVPTLMKWFDVGYWGPRQLASGNMYLSPLKVYEYLAMEVPVIAAGYEQLREVAGGGEVGFLFRPDGGDDVRRALREAYASSPERLAAMGATARKRVLSEHTWRSRIEDLERQVRKILGRQSS